MWGISLYLILGICVFSLISIIKRSLGLDTYSIELKRIRCILESQNSENSKFQSTCTSYPFLLVLHNAKTTMFTIADMQLRNRP